MKAPTRVKYFLVHVETGQRYALFNEDVVIGRTSGDILFSDDMKLSNQHCRIVMTAAGLGIHDLGSANGTSVDGKRLAPDKVYAFKPGALVQAGDQQFKLTEASLKKKLRRKRGRKKKQADSLAQMALFALALTALFFGGRMIYKEIRRPASASMPIPVVMESPYDMVDKELHAVIDQYKQLGTAVDSGSVSDKEMVTTIRTQLLPSFNLMQAKLSAVRPQGEFERRNLELNRQVCNTIIGQLVAMADNSETHSASSAEAVKKSSAALENLSAQLQALKKSRPITVKPVPGPKINP